MFHSQRSCNPACCAGRDNETDCVGRVTESIWARHANAAHPRTWSRRADVKPGLLMRLRTPNIDGDRCPAPPDATPARPPRAAMVALHAQLEEQWSAQVRQAADVAGAAASAARPRQLALSDSGMARMLLAESAALGAVAGVALRRFLGIRPGTRTRVALASLSSSDELSRADVSTVDSGNLTDGTWVALVAASQPGWMPRDSSCPLFARKFAAATAGAVARAYSIDVLPQSVVERTGRALY